MEKVVLAYHILGSFLCSFAQILSWFYCLHIFLFLKNVFGCAEPLLQFTGFL